MSTVEDETFGVDSSQSVQFSRSVMSHLLVTAWTVPRQASLSITNSQNLLKLMAIESVMPSNHLILCCPLLLLPSIFPTIRVFSNESALHIRRPEYWSFSFNISPSNEYSGLISFRLDWLDLLAAPGTLKSSATGAGQPQSRPGHRHLPAVWFQSGRPPTTEGCSQIGQRPQASP